jgi:hypothetical protein
MEAKKLNLKINGVNNYVKFLFELLIILTITILMWWTAFQG